jgi:hypothetical protein
VCFQLKNKAGCTDGKKRINHLRCTVLCLAQAFFYSVFSLLSQSVNALEGVSINVEQISSNDWQLNDISFSLFDFHNQTQQFASSIKHIQIPEPFSGLKFLDIQKVMIQDIESVKKR